MCKKNIIIPIEEYPLSSVDASTKQLIDSACEAARNAYAPYSNFLVGAAVRLRSGIIVTGSNQENAAYPSGLCAERTALFYAGAQYPNDPVEAIAVVAMRPDHTQVKLAAPCGGCRQVMIEVATRFQTPFSVILAGPEVVQIIKDCRDLLPIHFDASAL